jgi:hypothetical protein
MKSLIIMILGYFFTTQNSNEVVKVEFTSLTRGYQETLLITPDSIMSSLDTRSEMPVKVSRVNKKNDWECVLKSLKGISLEAIGDLESPTMKRAYDGARHSTITITTRSGAQFSHSFDDEEPHEKLRTVMKEIQKLRKKLKG